MKLIKELFRSLAVQLILVHFRANFLLILVWVLLFGFAAGWIGRVFGIKYLFLSPEYLGKVNSWSFFFLGLAFGAFTLIWQLTTYLLYARRFPFLATLRRPLRKFAINNIFLPLSFVIFLSCRILLFEKYYDHVSISDAILHVLSFWSGILIVVSFIIGYLEITNKDIFTFLGIRDSVPENLVKNLENEDEHHHVFTKAGRVIRVDFFWNEAFKVRRVRSVKHYDPELLEAVFKSNHSNALIIQLVIIFLLLLLQLGMDIPALKIPAGASIILLCATAVSLIGALTFWFGEWRYILIILLLLFFNQLTKFSGFKQESHAFGLRYDKAPFLYDFRNLDSLCRSQNVKNDRLKTTEILEKWKSKNTFSDSVKPKLVVLCLSGGGLRATLWATQVLLEADSILKGGLMRQSALITGASGGMVGGAAVRQKYLLDKLNRPSPSKNQLKEMVSKDLLNAIGFGMVTTDLLIPLQTFKQANQTYFKDRGYLFEKQLNDNLKNLIDKPISYFKKYEKSAEIPMMFISPSVVNDGRRMIISPQDVSYMCYPPVGLSRHQNLLIDAIEFRKMFRNYQADSLRMSTALRMNCTYPYILPNVHLPTIPSIELMDAGLRDNNGIISAARFIHNFADWIRTNTSGVVIVEIEDEPKKSRDKPDISRTGSIENLLNPLSIVGQVLKLQHFESSNQLGLLESVLGPGKLKIIRFVYSPTKNNERASMTFHLTNSEKSDVMNAFWLPKNQISLQQLKSVVKH
jgi:hypothetical protein